ncbi:MAG: hypothetical protein RLO51_09240 [Thalassobaculum sp.]|uniref:hypothetical protein n=1 Tax=Thalassobaculum sp. TaxID=2022740 RepID=UPI0032ECD4A4
MSAPRDDRSAPGSEVPQIDDSILLGMRSFRQPLWRALVQCALFLTIAGLGLSMVFGQPPRPDIGWPIAAVGLLAGILVPGLTTIGRRRRVELFDEGFVVHELFRTRHYRWSEVSDFGLATLLPGRGMRQTYVVYDARGDHGALVGFNRFLSGKGRSLPIGIEPADLPGNAVTVAYAMNAWRQRALDREAGRTA